MKHKYKEGDIVLVILDHDYLISIGFEKVNGGGYHKKNTTTILQEMAKFGTRIATIERLTTKNNCHFLEESLKFHYPLDIVLPLNTPMSKYLYATTKN